VGLSFVCGYVFTSHGGGALRYEGTILKVTEPLASLWNTSHEKSLAFYLSCLQRAALKGEMPLAITQMDTKNRICVFGGPFIGQILSVMLCAAERQARARTLSAINSDLWGSQSKRDQSNAFPGQTF
jgi:hypothetical protein